MAAQVKDTGEGAHWDDIPANRYTFISKHKIAHETAPATVALMPPHLLRH